MKVSFRAIKKAKNKLARGRKVKPWERIAIGVVERRMKRRRESAMRMAMAAMCAAQGAARLAFIQGSIAVNKTSKAMEVAKTVIETAIATQKALAYQFD